MIVVNFYMQFFVQGSTAKSKYVQEIMDITKCECLSILSQQHFVLHIWDIRPIPTILG